MYLYNVKDVLCAGIRGDRYLIQSFAKVNQHSCRAIMILQGTADQPHGKVLEVIHAQLIPVPLQPPTEQTRRQRRDMRGVQQHRPGGGGGSDLEVIRDEALGLDEVHAGACDFDLLVDGGAVGVALAQSRRGDVRVEGMQEEGLDERGVRGVDVEVWPAEAVELVVEGVWLSGDETALGEDGEDLAADVHGLAEAAPVDVA